MYGLTVLLTIITKLKKKDLATKTSVTNGRPFASLSLLGWKWMMIVFFMSFSCFYFNPFVNFLSNKNIKKVVVEVAWGAVGGGGRR